MIFIKYTKFSFSAIRQKLIQTSLLHVNKYGWNQRAIVAACTDLQLSPASQGLIKQAIDLINYLMDKWHYQTLKKIDDTLFGGQQKIKRKIFYSIKSRLQCEIPYINTWNQAMAVGIQPSNILDIKEKLWRYSDEVWIRCGDRSLDYNYYTKRFLFNAAYTSTQLYMLTDKTNEFFATWQFLQNRLKDIDNIGKIARQTGMFAKAVSTGLWSLRGLFQEFPTRVENPIQQLKHQLNNQKNNIEQKSESIQSQKKQN